MHEKFQQLIKRFSGQSVWDAESKQAVRTKLIQHMDAHPIKQRSFWTRLLSNRALAVGLAAIVLIVAGGGTVYACTDAQPGDALFGVRIHVAEPMVLAFTFDDEDKADIELAQTESRLVEWEQLQISGNTEAAEQHQKLFDEKLARLKDRIAKLESQGKNDKALEIAVRAEASISTHEHIVAIDNDEDGDGHAEVNLTSETNGSNSHVSIHSSAEASVKAGDTEVFKDQAQRRIDQASTMIAEVRAYITANANKLNAELKTKAESELDDAQKKLDDAKKALQDSKFSDSIILSANASADAQRVKILVNVAVRTDNAFFDDHQDNHDIDPDKLEEEIRSRVQDKLDKIFDDQDFPGIDDD